MLHLILQSVEYKNEIDKIKSKILNEEDELVKKSLMLTIFVLSESYVSSLIVSNLPERDENLIDKAYEKIIQQYISKIYVTRNGRKELVKNFKYRSTSNTSYQIERCPCSRNK